MPNMASAVARHNKGLLQQNLENTPPPCKCKTPCPVGGQCTLKDVVYQARVEEKIAKIGRLILGLPTDHSKSDLRSTLKIWQTPPEDLSLS